MQEAGALIFGGMLVAAIGFAIGVFVNNAMLAISCVG